MELALVRSRMLRHASLSRQVGGQRVVLIRKLAPGEELKLREVFYASVHAHAQEFYSREQLDAWAPRDFDTERWVKKMSLLKPYVAESDGKIVGYADLQEMGLIDHFFVAADAGRRGVGTKLMLHLVDDASRLGLSELHAFVSRSAEAFFAKHGFTAEERRTVSVDGVQLTHARMSKALHR